MRKQNQFWMVGLCASLLLGAAACSEEAQPEPAPLEDATEEELDGLLTENEGFDGAKADSSRGQYYRLRDGRYVFLGALAEELIDLGLALPNTRQFTSRGVTYTQSAFAFCAQRGEQRLCATYLDRVSRAEDPYVLFFGGQTGHRRSVAAQKADALAEAMALRAYQSDTLDNGAVYQQGTWFGCVSQDTNRGEQVYCGLYAEENKGQDTVEATALTVSFDNLPNLGPDFVYEGWFILGGEPFTAGRFDNQDGVDAFHFSFENDFSGSVAYVLTIEPRVGDDPGPSSTHILAGEFNADGEAALDTLHPAALGTDFSESQGAYFLQTPTSPEPDDFDQGIWFLDPSVGAPSLDLPELPDGWAYEGWVVGDNGPVSTGRFTDVAAPDNDGAGAAAGPLGGPPFPGQDFIDPAMSLLGNTVVISVEPEPDNSPAPFDFKPLVDVVDDGIQPGVLQPMSLNVDVQPSGRATMTLTERD